MHTGGAEQEYRNIKWIRLLLNNKTIKAFAHNKLEITQNKNAWKQYGNENIISLESRELYNILSDPWKE